MSRMVRFTFDEKQYEVGIEAYEKNRILIPDGRLLVAERWLESMPPQPVKLKVRNDLFAGTSNPTKKDAENLNAALAKEVTITQNRN